MARPLRATYLGAWHHTFNRGRRREKIFFSDSDRRLFFDLLAEFVKLFKIEVHAYSLMPNHYHLLLHTPLGNLSRAMRHLNGVYTQKINKRYKTEGSLFKGRFKSILVEKDSYLEELIRYIHRNPYKAGLEKEIGAYIWTSHFAYMNKQKRPAWLTTEEVFACFGKDEKEALPGIDAFVKQKPAKDLSQLLDKEKWPAVLAGKDFKEKIKNKLDLKKFKKSQIPQYKECMKSLSADEAIKTMEAKIGEKDIFKKKRNKKYLQKRKAAAYIFRQHLYLPHSDISKALGGMSYAAVSKQFSAAATEIEAKKGCYRDWKEMVKMLKLKVET